MKKPSILFCLILAAASYCQAQGVNVTSWIFNTTNNTYNGILTDVESVYYTGSNVYIKSSGIPWYYQDGLTVNDGDDMDWVFNIPRNPAPNTGTPTVVGQGQVGIYLDGSVMFHPGDAQSYQSGGQWWRLAYVFEHNDFDPSLGHSTPNNTYHHHVFNKELASINDSSKHGALVGFAWDGYPVYGGFGYSDPNDSTSAITRMRSSYQKRNMSSRTTLPDGTPSTGPAIGGQYPLGCFIEDYEYIAGSGTLDEHNGRFCITPEYPSGTYAYFKTIDENLEPAYPYHIGKTFYGIVQGGNVGPNGGHATVPGSAVQYIPTVSGIADQGISALSVKLYPNPVKSQLYLETRAGTSYTATVTDMQGRPMTQVKLIGNELDMEALPAGNYVVTLTGGDGKRMSSLVTKN